MRVVVVGAGLAGLAAAVALHRSGHEVRVLERRADPRERGAGIGIMPNGVLALDAIGLGAEVRARATPLGEGALRDRHGRPLLRTDQAEMSRLVGAPTAVVRRRWLHGLLASALPDGLLHTGRPVAGLAEVSDGADLVVVADGAGSRLRAELFPGHPGLAGSGETAARGIAPAAELAARGLDPAAVAALPAGELLDHRTGERTGCMPMAGGDVYWYATWPGVGIEPTDPEERQAWLLDRRAGWHPAVPVLLAATAAAEVHVTETVQLVRPLPSVVAGPVALLGDAAHAMTPDLGQGACQAFEDAATLAAVLTDDLPASLARYDRLRGPRTAALQRTARRANRVLTLRGPAARARDAVLRRLPVMPVTRAMAAQLRFSPPSEVTSGLASPR